MVRNDNLDNREVGDLRAAIEKEHFNIRTIARDV